MISEWPGLVARPDPALIEDCLVLVEHLGDARKVVDVGSGGGLPGLPLKIARPDLELTLIEADQAKAAFLVQACARLGLEGVEVVARRAEEAGHDPRLREAFDVAVARALAPMPVLTELCLGLVRVGGRLLAQKTESEDHAAAEHAIEIMGGAFGGVHASPSAARAAAPLWSSTRSAQRLPATPGALASPTASPYKGKRRGPNSRAVESLRLVA